MNAELVCIRRLLPVTEQHFDYVLALDGMVCKSVEERLQADAPVYEVMVAFCPCALRPESGGCIQQALGRNARGSRGRQPKCHRTGGSRDDGSGSGGSDGDPDPGPHTAARRRFQAGRRQS